MKIKLCLILVIKAYPQKIRVKISRFTFGNEDSIFKQEYFDLENLEHFGLNVWKQKIKCDLKLC